MHLFTIIRVRTQKLMPDLCNILFYSFIFLGGIVTKWGTHKDIAQKIRKANRTFLQLYKIWRNKNI